MIDFSQIPEYFPDFGRVLFWGTDISPPFLGLVQPVKRAVIIGAEPMGDAALLEYGFQHLRFKFMVQNVYFNIIVHFVKYAYGLTCKHGWMYYDGETEEKASLLAFV